jgi:hypothetical protein
MRHLLRINLLPRIQDIFYIALFFAVLILGNRMLNLDGDLPRHLLMGQRILQTGEVPTTELFIHPYLGRHYVTHEWLADVIFFGIYTAVGLKGIVLFAAFALATTFFLIYQYVTTRFQNRLGAFVLVAWGAARNIPELGHPPTFDLDVIFSHLAHLGRQVAARGENSALDLPRFHAGVEQHARRFYRRHFGIVRLRRWMGT